MVGPLGRLADRRQQPEGAGGSRRPTRLRPQPHVRRFSRLRRRKAGGRHRGSREGRSGADTRLGGIRNPASARQNHTRSDGQAAGAPARRADDHRRTEPVPWRGAGADHHADPRAPLQRQGDPAGRTPAGGQRQGPFDTGAQRLPRDRRTAEEGRRAGFRGRPRRSRSGERPACPRNRAGGQCDRHAAGGRRRCARRPRRGHKAGRARTTCRGGYRRGRRSHQHGGTRDGRGHRQGRTSGGGCGDGRGGHHRRAN